MIPEKFPASTVVILMAGGILALTMLFIFVKRQIMRFTLRLRRGPHAPIGHDAKKSFRREIERRIEVIPKIVYEPKLLPDDDPKYILPPSENNMYPSGLYCRQRTVDDVKKLGMVKVTLLPNREVLIFNSKSSEKEIAKHDKTLSRHPAENLRAYLLNTLTGPPSTVSQRTIHQFCDLYEQARYDPSEFTEEEYRTFSRILLKLLDSSKMLKTYSNVRKSSPSRIPAKKSNVAQKPIGDNINEDQDKEIRLKPEGETPV